jgi:formylglycine-generating enzyme required for sulfatase activity
LEGRGSKRTRIVALVGVLAVVAAGLALGIPGMAEVPPTPPPSESTPPLKKPPPRAAPQPRQEGIHPRKLEGSVKVTTAILRGDYVIVAGTIEANAVVRITLDGAPLTISADGTHFQALLGRRKTSFKLVAEGFDGEELEQTVLIGVPEHEEADPPALKRHLDGQTYYERDLMLELTEEAEDPRLAVVLDRVETYVRSGEGIVRLYRAPEGLVFLRVSRTGQYCFLRERDQQEVMLIPSGISRRGFGEEPPTGPRHTVRLSAYLIDRTEVSCAQYSRFLNYMTRVGDRSLRHRADAGADLRPRDWTSDQPPLGAESLPVTGVSWFGAYAYCRWVGGRLPTEAEWERAGAGAGGMRFPWGDKYDPERGNASSAQSMPARSLLAGASVYGLLHMSGNAREWCGDQYGPRWYRYDTRINPRGPSGNRHRVIRGGSYASSLNSLVLQVREHAAPDENPSDLGFRVARTWPDTIR